MYSICIYIYIYICSLVPYSPRSKIGCTGPGAHRIRVFGELTGSGLRFQDQRWKGPGTGASRIKSLWKEGWVFAR